MATSFFEANSCPLGYFLMNVSKDSIFPNRKYILLMKLSFPRWYITGSALVEAKVTRKDSTPFRCRRFNML
jgi:hypothetical protein